jgi:hypothetical protein
MLSLALFLNAEIADGLVKIAREKFNEIASVFGYSEADKSTLKTERITCSRYINR